MIASQEGHVGVVEVLLKSKTNVRVCDNDGDTALVYAASMKGGIAVCSLLLSHRADPNGSTQPPLYCAAERGNAELCEFLLEKRANPNAKSRGLWAPLFVAAEKGHLAVCQVLLKHGADLHAVSGVDSGLTALQAAERNGHKSVRSLLKSATEV